MTTWAFALNRIRQAALPEQTGADLVAAAAPNSEAALEPLLRTTPYPSWPVFAEDEVAGILRRLAFGVVRANGVFTVTVPSWRATKDISIKDDLVEEVGRMIGYASIPPVAPSVPSSVPPLQPERAFQRRVRGLLTANGFTEVYNYSFVSEAQAAQLQLPVSDHIRVLNPIAAGQELLRTSLLPNILKNIELNRHNFDNFRLFEIGREIHKREGALPEEIPSCAVVLYSKEGDGQAGLFEVA